MKQMITVCVLVAGVLLLGWIASYFFQPAGVPTQKIERVCTDGGEFCYSLIFDVYDGKKYFNSLRVL